MYTSRRGEARVESATAAGQPQLVGARRTAAIAPPAARTAHRIGDRVYGEMFWISATWSGPTTRRT